MSLKDEVVKLDVAIKMLETASDYTDSYLKHGNGCDSGEGAKYRVDFALRAEKAFLENHKRDILDMAVTLAKRELDEAKMEITK